MCLQRADETVDNDDIMVAEKMSKTLALHIGTERDYLLGTRESSAHSTNAIAKKEKPIMYSKELGTPHVLVVII